MNKIAVLTPQKGEFTVVNQGFHFARIPSIGEKILIEDTVSDSILTTFVYEIIDVHFDHNGNADLFAVKIGTNEVYKQTLDKTITE